MSRRGRARRWLGALVILGAGLLLAGLAAPPLINRGLFRGAIEASASAAVGAPVTIDRLGLSWFHGQELGGVRIRDDDGAEAARLDIHVAGGLWGHLFGSGGIDATARGYLRAVVRDDGTLSIDGLLGRDPAADSDPAGAQSDQPADVRAAEPASPLRIAVADTVVEIELPEGDHVTLGGVRGLLVFMPGATSTLSVDATVESGGRQGSIQLSARGDRLFDGQGRLVTDGVNIEVDLELDEIGAPAHAAYRGRVAAIEHAVLRVRSIDLAQATLVELDAAVAMDSGTVESASGRLEFGAGETRPFSARLVMPDLRAEASGALERDGTLRAQNARVEAIVPPALVQAWSGPDFTIDAPLDAVVTVTALTLPGPDDDGVRDISRVEARARLEVRDVTLRRTTGEALAVESLVVDVDGVPIGDAVDIRAVAVTDAGGVTVAERVRGLVANGIWTPEAMRPEGSVVFEAIRIDRVAALLGQAGLAERLAPFERATFDGRIENATDAPDRAEATLDGTLHLATSRFAVGADVAQQGSARTVTRAEVSGDVTPALIKALQPGKAGKDRVRLEAGAFVALALVEPLRLPDGGASGSEAGAGTEPATLHVALDIADAPLRWPGTEEAIRLRDLTLDARRAMDGGALSVRIDHGAIERAATGETVAGLRAVGVELVDGAWRGDVTLDRVNGAALAAIVGRSIAGSPTSDGACTLSFSGRAIDVVGPDDVPLGAIEGTLTAEAIPTALLDVLMDSAGLVTAALGPTIDITASAADLSRQSGQLEVDARSSAARIFGRLNARDGRLRSAGSAPLSGTLELTPALRSRLLANIHPLLADVRTVEAPLRADLAQGFALPLDGDLSRLNGDLTITVGAVEFDSGSLMLGILAAFDVQGEIVPGYIQPIEMKIRNGVVKTQRFEVQLNDDIDLAFSGEVDLNAQTADLRTEIPLRALANAVEETRGYVDDVVIPIVYRGELGSLRPQVDPDFDLAGTTLESTIQNAIRKVLVDELDGVDKILRDVLGGG